MDLYQIPLVHRNISVSGIDRHWFLLQNVISFQEIYVEVSVWEEEKGGAHSIGR